MTNPNEQPTLLLKLAQWQLRHRASRSNRRRLVAGLVAGVGVVVLATTAAIAYWTVSGQGSGQAQAATVSNLTIAAIASPSPAHQLYPGATGDAVLSITNPNAFPVTITAVQLPANTSNADGYSNTSLTSPIGGCAAATPSGVAWNFATSSSGSSHTLTNPLTVAANDTLTVTLINDVAMASTSPLACAGAYFKLPAITGLTATGGAAAPTASPATDSWTS